MKKNMQIYVLIGLTLGFLVLLFLLYPGLPEQFPMQWGVDGKVNYSFPKLVAVSGMTLIQVAFHGFSIFTHRNDTKIPSKDFFTSLLIFGIFTAILMFVYFA